MIPLTPVMESKEENVLKLQTRWVAEAHFCCKVDSLHWSSKFYACNRPMRDYESNKKHNKAEKLIFIVSLLESDHESHR